MRTKTTVLEGIKPCYYQKKIEIELKSQQPWTAVSALLGLNSMAQLANESWVPDVMENDRLVGCGLM